MPEDRKALNVVMLETGRFHALQEAIGPGLIRVDAGYWPTLRYLRKHLGLAAFLALRFSRPELRHKEMAQGNLLRKSARFSRAMSSGWIQALYEGRKVRHAQMAEHMLRHVLSQVDDPVCLIYNGFNVPDSVLRDVAPAHRRIFIENGYFAGTIQADPLGINADNSLPRDPAFFRAYQPDARPLDLVLNTRQPKHAVHDAEPLPESYVFLPFQVDSDSQITRHSPWIRDMAHLHAEALRLVKANPDLKVVIKEHPNSRYVLSGRVKAHPNILFQNGRSTEDLILNARAMVTINSTVGLEALARGTPVITLGNACYNVPGLVHHATDAQSLAVLLNDPAGLSFDGDLARRFLHYLFYEFLIPESGHYADETIEDRLNTVLARADYDVSDAAAG